jgi:hypothetical protein
VPFNEEVSYAAMEKYQQCVAVKNYEHWYRLEIWDENAMGTVDVVDGIKKFYLWSQAQGCIATAVVVANSI